MVLQEVMFFHQVGDGEESSLPGELPWEQGVNDETRLRWETKVPP